MSIIEEVKLKPTEPTRVKVDNGGIRYAVLYRSTGKVVGLFCSEYFARDFVNERGFPPEFEVREVAED